MAKDSDELLILVRQLPTSLLESYTMDEKGGQIEQLTQPTAQASEIAKAMLCLVTTEGLADPFADEYGEYVLVHIRRKKNLIWGIRASEVRAWFRRAQQHTWRHTGKVDRCFRCGVIRRPDGRNGRCMGRH